jgi:hypothetical protein
LDELGVDGWMILKWVLKIRCDSMEWIKLAQDMDKFRAVLHLG